MFRVGQKVVCINATSGNYPDIPRPTEGAIYTVSAIHATVPAIQVAEIAMPRKNDWFLARRFRPLTERKTDISVFSSLLNPTKRQIRESIGLDLGFTLEEIGEE